MNNTIIEAIDLKKRFGKLTAVDSISFKVNKGEVFAFLGPNWCHQKLWQESKALIHQNYDTPENCRQQYGLRNNSWHQKV